MGSENKICFLFQSTHPQGCDARIWRYDALHDVSIHTPTKGVTIGAWSILRKGSSFNPHTHEGCDYGEGSGVESPRGFNPHTHEGCDLNADFGLPHLSVSIHTPTKGVTDSVTPLSKEYKMFQSTHPRRV